MHGMNTTARAVSLIFVLLAVLMLPSARVAAQTFPGSEWKNADPADAGWSKNRLEAAKEFAQKLDSTAVLIVQDGRVLAAWGNVAQKVRVNSIRKSVLSGLYGIAVTDGRIDLRKTMRDLGIDDTPPALTDAEKKATIRDLLMARSGVYHEAAAESDHQKQVRPQRGSHPHGTFWYYNNWDFNALGTIYRQLTGEDIFAAVETRIARPIDMQDFTAADGRYVSHPASIHPAYHMNFTARDLARFGWLYFNGGRWGDRQIVPEAWVRESTKPLSDSPGGPAYGYLWWFYKKDLVLGAKVRSTGIFAARGNGGQFMFVLPDRHLVVVHLHARGTRDQDVGQLLGRIMLAAPGSYRPLPK